MSSDALIDLLKDITTAARQSMLLQSFLEDLLELPEPEREGAMDAAIGALSRLRPSFMHTLTPQVAPPPPPPPAREPPPPPPVVEAPAPPPAAPDPITMRQLLERPDERPDRTAFEALSAAYTTAPATPPADTTYGVTQNGVPRKKPGPRPRTFQPGERPRVPTPPRIDPPLPAPRGAPTMTPNGPLAANMRARILKWASGRHQPMGPFTAADAARCIGAGANFVASELERMVMNGQIQRERRGIFRLDPSAVLVSARGEVAQLGTPEAREQAKALMRGDTDADADAPVESSPSSPELR